MKKKNEGYGFGLGAEVILPTAEDCQLLVDTLCIHTNWSRKYLNKLSVEDLMSLRAQLLKDNPHLKGYV